MPSGGFRGIAGFICLTANRDSTPDLEVERLINARDTGGSNVCTIDKCEGIYCGENGEESKVDLATGSKDQTVTHERM